MFIVCLLVCLQKLHCNVIISRNPIEANANTSEIQPLGNYVAYTIASPYIRNSFRLYL